jgi:RNA polymerase sigma-70 factor (ECF subfamily)
LAKQQRVAENQGMVDDTEVVDALRRGDEAAFRQVVMQYHSALVRTAQSFVRSQAVAEEVAQDTWLAVIRGLATFEGRSSFKTWLFRILLNQARTRGQRESRITATGSFLEEDEASVSASRFNDMDARWPRHWRAFPTDWGQLPDATLESAETRSVIEGAIEALPSNQRQVITLRDMEGFDSREVSAALDLSEGNQRVLLHRARSRVRAALELHLEGVATA